MSKHPPDSKSDAKRLETLMRDPVNNLREIAESLGQIEPQRSPAVCDNTRKRPDDV